MKNLIYILLFAFIISSCNKDDKKEDPELNIPFELVGKWKVTKRFIQKEVLIIGWIMIQDVNGTIGIRIQVNLSNVILKI